MNPNTVELLLAALISVITSGSLLSLLNWRANRAKVVADTANAESDAESKRTLADHGTIEQLVKVNELYSSRVTTLDGKVADLERMELERRKTEVELEIRVKRLEAELAITVQTVRNRDQTIAHLQLALDECRAIVASQNNSADFYYGE